MNSALRRSDPSAQSQRSSKARRTTIKEPNWPVENTNNHMHQTVYPLHIHTMQGYPSKLSAQYSITHSLWRHDYEVAGTHVFHVDNSAFQPGKPDLTFHAGRDTNAPIAGVCKFRHFSSDTEIGLGNPSLPTGMSWERLSSKGFKKVQYAFCMSLADRPPQTFTWKKTHSLGKGGSSNLKLVEEQTQNVVAVFSSGGSFSKRTGQLDIYADYGERFHLMVLITGLALREKLRRKSNAAAGAASGGGAAGGGC